MLLEPYFFRRLPESSELTGVWITDLDGVYYLRQLDDTVVWFGSQRDRSTANVFKGTFAGDRLAGRWMDIPYGASSSATGELTLELHGGESPFAMRRVAGGLSDEENRWLKVAG